MTANTWNVRPLNMSFGGVLDGVSTSLTVSTNTIVFQPGTYKVFARAACFGIGATQLRLQDTSNATTLVTGLSVYTTTSAQSAPILSGIFNITGTTNVQLQQNCQTTRATNGMGVGISSLFSTMYNVFAQLEIYKLA